MSCDLRCPIRRWESQRFQIAAIWNRRAPAKLQAKSPLNLWKGGRDRNWNCSDSSRFDFKSLAGWMPKSLAIWASKLATLHMAMYDDVLCQGKEATEIVIRYRRLLKHAVNVVNCRDASSPATSDPYPTPQKLSKFGLFVSFPKKYRTNGKMVNLLLPRKFHRESIYQILGGEGNEDSNFSVFRVRRFTEWPRPLHRTAFRVEILTKPLIHWMPPPVSLKNPFFSHWKVLRRIPFPKSALRVGGGVRNRRWLLSRSAAFLLTIGSFLLTVELFYLQLKILALYLQLELFHLQFWLFTYSQSFLLASGKCL